MDFSNNHWDILHKIMKMKEEAEYFDKIEKRAKSNYVFVLKELEKGQRGRLPDNFCVRIRNGISCAELKKSSCGRYYLKNIGLEEPNWVRLNMNNFNYKKCDSFMEYLKEQYEEWECGGFYNNEEGVVGDIPEEVSDFDTFCEEWVALHGLHFKLEEIISGRFRAKMYYRLNDPICIKEELEENHSLKETNEKFKQKDRFRYGKQFSDLSSPFDFINKLEKGALHYLKCKDYTWANIEEKKDYCDRNDIPFNEREAADSHYFINGINQPEEDPSWA